ncbi:DUF1385 domain-containing protein [Candidatus Magnetobacterium casense]|uniref:DUF1385 domain-containing protein n=1 Tax=Candidatus Magnetobacterium casense TaxID=1455061 RepID=A0ABS6S0U9_9BACT|nr:DUF1385 domain-containing protein [Candidatus Magnetobacterium casensis]MBV6342481.1 DUF1385 domain-containing protein [Candidatus Magnetobacterium casensis]
MNPLQVGGQAVIEGVMMKSGTLWSVAVRDRQGVIHVKSERLNPLPKVLKLPLVRGVVALFQSVALGIKALDYSANKAYEEEGQEPLSPTAMGMTIGFSLLLGIGLFLFLPLYLTKLIGLVFPIVAESSLMFNMVDGVIRVVFFVAYVFAVGCWKEMRRVFEYHGAEHKVIFAYEAGGSMAVEAVRSFSRYHPRCGTSFLFIVMILSMLIFSVIPKEWAFYMKFGSRLVLIPLIAGTSYEILKLSARLSKNPLVRLLIQPGLMLQYITTKEPDEKQIEVALRALMEVVPTAGAEK